MYDMLVERVLSPLMRNGFRKPVSIHSSCSVTFLILSNGSFFYASTTLGFLLDCAKKTDQSVVSILLGALVHLIEVGGHQFSDGYWDTLLKSIRDASYTTQPLELLNSLGFVNSKNQTILSKDSEAKDGGSTFKIMNENRKDDLNNQSLSVDTEESGKTISTTKDHWGSSLQTDLEESNGLPSPSGGSLKPAEAADFQRSQTFGQRIMDNLLLQNQRTTQMMLTQLHLQSVMMPQNPFLMIMMKMNTQ